MKKVETHDSGLTTHDWSTELPEDERSVATEDDYCT